MGRTKDNEIDIHDELFSKRSSAWSQEIRDEPKMLQLIRIDYGSDGLNGATGDIEFDDRNETILVVEEQGAGLTVHGCLS
jgi:hypothetical protein